MRILHVITAIERGGAENHLFALVRGQRAAGHEVAVAYLKGAADWGPAYADLAVEVIALGMSRYGDPAPLMRLRRLTARFDLVHAHLPPGELYARLALLGRRTPLVLSKHNDNPFYRGPFSVALARWVARRADCVIAISDAVNAYMCDAGLPAAKLRTIHYGLRPSPVPSPREIAALREQWGGAQGLIFGCVARLVEQKALHVLIEAYRLYREASAAPSRLSIVGDGPLRSALVEQVKRSGLDQHVIWAGRRADIATVMRALDVFVLSSVHEGFGLVLLEAMEAGKPIVATRVSAIPEVVVDGTNGILVPPGDCAAMAVAMKQMEDASRRERLGAAGRQRLLEHFPENLMVSRTLEVYGRTLGGVA